MTALTWAWAAGFVACLLALGRLWLLAAKEAGVRIFGEYRRDLISRLLDVAGVLLAYGLGACLGGLAARLWGWVP